MEEHVSQSIIFENGIGHLPLTEGWGVYTTSVNATLVGPGNVYIRDVAGDGIDFETDSEDPNAEAYVYWVGSFPQVGDDDPDGQEYDVDFEVDYNNCGTDPEISTGGVSFGSAGNVKAGRACSKLGYKNISKIEADLDLSGLAQRSGFTGDWLNAAFYAVTSDKQPKGNGNYCDAEFEPKPGDPGYPCPFCNEIDFIETNGQKMFQHTLHLADDKQGPQRYEVSFTDAANTECWEWDEMQAAAGSPGVHDLVGKIDPNKSFHMEVVFNADYTNMTITLSQGGGDPVTVFDMNEPAYPGSDTLDMSKLKDAMEVGWWFTPSYHGDWSPGVNDPHWYKDSGGACGHGTLCGDGGGWKLANLKVTAEGTVG